MKKEALIAFCLLCTVFTGCGQEATGPSNTKSAVSKSASEKQKQEKKPFYYTDESGVKREGIEVNGIGLGVLDCSYDKVSAVDKNLKIMILYYALKNNDKKECKLCSDSIKLIDSKGREYKATKDKFFTLTPGLDLL